MNELFYIQNVYFCVFMMIVNDKVSMVCVWIYICAVYSIYTYMHIQYVVGCILSPDLCKI